MIKCGIKRHLTQIKHRTHLGERTYPLTPLLLWIFTQACLCAADIQKLAQSSPVKWNISDIYLHLSMNSGSKTTSAAPIPKKTLREQKRTKSHCRFYFLPIHLLYLQRLWRHRCHRDGRHAMSDMVSFKRSYGYPGNSHISELKPHRKGAADFNQFFSLSCWKKQKDLVKKQGGHLIRPKPMNTQRLKWRLKQDKPKSWEAFCTNYTKSGLQWKLHL